jgi:hypothetical protein
VIASLPRLAALAAFVCLSVTIAGCDRVPQYARDPESAANAFFAAVETGDARAAYDSSAFGFRATETYDAFISNARELGIVGGKAPVWTHKEITESEARLDGSIVNESGRTINLSVTLTETGGEWKLFSLDSATEEDDGKTHTLFKEVGKGAGINDVYHQPMPTQEQLAKLVHETIDKFNAAVSAQDFHAFYGYISQQWKDGRRKTGEATAGVTENMLKAHFQGFADQKIDLAEVAFKAPVFDRAPVIDQDGLLDLQGHFDTSKFRVAFFLQYAYELPRWRLFGIELRLTK